MTTDVFRGILRHWALYNSASIWDAMDIYAMGLAFMSVCGRDDQANYSKRQKLTVKQDNVSSR